MRQIVFDFAKNRDELAPDYEEKVKSYLKENSEERGQGYLDALREIMSELDFIIYKPFGEGYCLARTPHIVKTSVMKFHNANSFVLKKIDPNSDSKSSNFSPD